MTFFLVTRSKGASVYSSVHVYLHSALIHPFFVVLFFIIIMMININVVNVC